MKSLKDFIQENSFYSGDAEKEAFMDDKQKVANAFFINLLGFLGLCLLDPKSPILRAYFRDDGKVQVKGITDDNNDISLAMKNYGSAVVPNAQREISKLLLKLKRGKVEFDDAAIRNIVKSIRYHANRPHPKILKIVDDFVEGESSLTDATSELYYLAKNQKKLFQDQSGEFMGIARRFVTKMRMPRDTADAELSLAPVDDAPQMATIDFDDIKDTPKPPTFTDVLGLEPIEEPKKASPSWDDMWAELNAPAEEPEKPSYRMIEKADVMQFWLKFLSHGDGVNLAREELEVDLDNAETRKKFLSILKFNMDDKELNLLAQMMPSFRQLSRGQLWMSHGDELKPYFQMLYGIKVGNTKNYKSMVDLIAENEDILRDLDVNETGLGGWIGEDVLELVVATFSEMWGSEKPLINQDRLEQLLPDINLAGRALVKSNYGSPKFTLMLLNKGSLRTAVARHLAYMSDHQRDWFEEAAESFDKLMSETTVRVEREGSQHIVMGFEQAFPNDYVDYAVNHYIGHPYYQFLIKASFDLAIENAAAGFNRAPVWEKALEVIEKSFEDRLEEVPSLLTQEIRKRWQNNDTILNHLELVMPRGKSHLHSTVAIAVLADVNDSSKPDGDKIDNFIGQRLSWADNYDEPFMSYLVGLARERIANSKAALVKMLGFAVLFDGGVERFCKHTGFSVQEAVDILLEQGADETTLYNILTPAIIKVLKPETTKQAIDLMTSDRYQKRAFDLLLAADIPIRDYMSDDAIMGVVKWMLDYGLTGDDLVFNKAKDALSPEALEGLIQDQIENMFDDIGDMYLMNRWPVYVLSQIDPNRLRAEIDGFSAEKLSEMANDSPEIFFEIASSRAIGDYLDTITTDSVATSSGAYDRIVLLLSGRTDVDIKHLNNLMGVFLDAYDEAYDNDRDGTGYHLNLVKKYASNLMDHIHTRSPEDADRLFEGCGKELKRVIRATLSSKKVIQKMRDEIAGDHVPIKPAMELTDEKILDIMTYNNIQWQISDELAYSTDSLSESIAKFNPPQISQPLSIEEVKRTDEEMKQFSVQYDRFNARKHGDIAIRFLKEFDVKVPVQQTGWKEWLAKMDAEGYDPKLMQPVFHGTGSIGASMILRYGFKIIPERADGVAGRALGDGIYFSTVLDKVSQYVGDEGFNKGVPGLKGYIFEMKASLGHHPEHYACAGTGAPEDDLHYDFISPEWCVFNANEQLLIYKCYEIETISTYEIDQWKREAGLEESEEKPMMSLKQFIHEESNSERKQVASFLFMDGMIPVAKDKFVPVEKFNPRKYGNHVKLDMSANGPVVMIWNNGDQSKTTVPHTKPWMATGAFRDYLSLLNS